MSNGDIPPPDLSGPSDNVSWPPLTAEYSTSIHTWYPENPYFQARRADALFRMKDLGQFATRPLGPSMQVPAYPGATVLGWPYRSEAAWPIGRLGHVSLGGLPMQMHAMQRAMARRGVGQGDPLSGLLQGAGVAPGQQPLLPPGPIDGLGPLPGLGPMTPATSPLDIAISVAVAVTPDEHKKDVEEALNTLEIQEVQGNAPPGSTATISAQVTQIGTMGQSSVPADQAKTLTDLIPGTASRPDPKSPAMTPYRLVFFTTWWHRWWCRLFEVCQSMG
jgi:hypothetical protein